MSALRAAIEASRLLEHRLILAIVEPHERLARCHRLVGQRRTLPRRSPRPSARRSCLSAGRQASSVDGMKRPTVHQRKPQIAPPITITAPAISRMRLRAGDECWIGLGRCGLGG